MTALFFQMPVITENYQLYLLMFKSFMCNLQASDVSVTGNEVNELQRDVLTLLNIWLLVSPLNT